MKWSRKNKGFRWAESGHLSESVTEEGERETAEAREGKKG